MFRAAIVPLTDGNVIVVASVPESVRLLVAVNVLPSEMVRVAPVAGVVKVYLFKEVAVATSKVGVINEGDEARTAAPVPVTAVIPVPLIWKTFPVPAVLNVLFVRISVVALPTMVSVVAGTDHVPEATAAGVNVVVPLVLPERSKVPRVLPARPTVSCPALKVRLPPPVTVVEPV
jgi:hypothetical protein